MTDAIKKETNGASRAKQIRQARARRLAKRFGIWVCIPTFLSIIYYGLIASPEYESTAVISIQSSDGPLVELGMLNSILPSAHTGRDPQLVREYVQSRDMLALLEQDHQFLQNYKDPNVDWWSRLSADADSETTYDYYRSKVHASYIADSGTLVLKVRAFSAERAQTFATAILDYGEQMVNRMSDRARADRTELATREFTTAEKRLAAARTALIALQKKRGVLDPTKDAAGVLAIEKTLETRLAEATAELAGVESIMQPDSAKVVQARQLVSSLRREIERQNRRISEEGMSESIADFEAAVLEKELAERLYATALNSLEIARIEAARQQRYVVTVSSASRPDIATYPHKRWSIASVFFCALALMGIVSLLGAAISEHAKI